jgi:hypothetical protein
LFAWDNGNPPRNNETVCDSTILQRQAWLPLYMDWKDKLSSSSAASSSYLLPRDEQRPGRLLPPVSLSMDVTRRTYDEMLPLVYFPMIPDVLYDKSKSRTKIKRPSALQRRQQDDEDDNHDDDEDEDSIDDDLRPRLGSIIYRNEWIDHPMHLDQYQEYIFDLPKQQQHIMARLYSEGVEFLYGMLFERFFTLFPLEQQQQQQQSESQQSESQQQQQPQDVGVVNNDTDQASKPTATTTRENNTAPSSSSSSSSTSFHVVVHSRHIAPADDGSFINYEMDCLEQMLNHYFLAAINNNHTSTETTSVKNSHRQQQQQQDECRIVVMSDRPKTVHLIQTWLQEHPVYRNACTVLTTLDNNNENDMMTSPGPVAEVRTRAFVHCILATTLFGVCSPTRSWKYIVQPCKLICLLCVCFFRRHFENVQYLARSTCRRWIF